MSLVSTVSNAWIDGYRKMFCYQGRSRRRDFISYMAIQFVLFFILMFAAASIGKMLGNSEHPVAIGLVGIFMLVWFLGTLSYNVRRFHDAGISGWFCLLYIGFGAFVIGAAMAVPPNVGDNKYGANPRVTD